MELGLNKDQGIDPFDSDEISSEESSGESVRYIIANLGSELYGLPLDTVREVIPLPEVTPIPFTPNFCVGAINLRGKVVTVIDLRLKLGMPNVKSRQTTVIICDLSPLTIGIVVDSVECVLSVPVSAIQPSSRVQGDPARNFFTGVYEVDGSLFLLIDPARAVNVHSYLESLAGAG